MKYTQEANRGTHKNKSSVELFALSFFCWEEEHGKEDSWRFGSCCLVPGMVLATLHAFGLYFQWPDFLSLDWSSLPGATVKLEATWLRSLMLIFDFLWDRTFFFFFKQEAIWFWGSRWKTCSFPPDSHNSGWRSPSLPAKLLVSPSRHAAAGWWFCSSLLMLGESRCPAACVSLERNPDNYPEWLNRCLSSACCGEVSHKITAVKATMFLDIIH